MERNAILLPGVTAADVTPTDIPFLFLIVSILHLLVCRGPLIGAPRVCGRPLLWPASRIWKLSIEWELGNVKSNAPEWSNDHGGGMIACVWEENRVRRVCSLLDWMVRTARRKPSASVSVSCVLSNSANTQGIGAR